MTAPRPDSLQTKAGLTAGISRPVRRSWPALTSAFLALLLYAITLGGTYVYDDLAVVHDDPRVREPAHWHELLRGNYNNGGDNLYRPLVSFSYAFEWFLHGDRPWIFHLVNVLLNAGVAAAVAEVTRRGLCNSAAPNAAGCVAGCLFAAHPLHVEAVANIVGRAELACALAVLSSVAIIARRPLTMPRAVAAVVCGFVGMLCKEQAVLAPLLWVMLGLFRWRDRGLAPAERRVVRNLVLITAWVWAGYLVGREHILKFEWDLSSMDPTMQPLMRSVGLDRVLMPVVLIGHYAALFVWPARLSLDYGADVIGYRARVGDPYLWIGFAAIGGWCCAVIVAWVRRSGFIVFTLFAMAVTYGVVGNILTLIGTNFGERLVYLPSAFLIMAVAGVATRLRPRSWMPAVMIVVLVGSVKTFTAARDWNDPLVLYQRALAATPRSIQVQLMLSAEYRSRGNATAADAVMDEVCREYPGYWRVWMFRASADMDEGDLVRARRDLNHAIHLDAQPILLAVQGRLDHLLAATRPVKQ